MQLSPSFSSISYEDNILIANAGITVNQLISFSQDRGVSGFEFMAGVPASVGGMVAMNFGCWDIEVSDRLAFVDVYIPGNGLTRLTKEECLFSYRSSVFLKQSWMIIQAAFHMTEDSPSCIKERVRDYVKQRVDKQPIRGQTFGSVFKNPENSYAAQLIEEVGLKGFQHKGVQVSDQHANFFINHEKASCEDVRSMIGLIQKDVYAKFKIRLEPEVTIFGD